MTGVTSIFLAPGAQLRLGFEDIGVEAGLGAHRLALRYQATPVGLPPGSVALISGALRLQRTLSWIGALQADQPLPVSAAAVYPRSLLLGTTISDPQLAGIEADRNGSDLELLIDLKVALVGAASMDYPASDAQDSIRIQGPIWAPTPSGSARLSPCR